MAQTPKPHAEQPLTWQHNAAAQQSPGTVAQTSVTKTDVSQHTSHHHHHSHNDASAPAAVAQQQASSGHVIQAEPLQKWQLHSATPSEASSVLSDSLTGPLLDQPVAAPKGSAQSVHAS
jgi:hypothetical protein